MLPSAGTDKHIDSNIADSVLRDLFRQMDIQIMVADLETDVILFANEKMNAAYNVGHDPVGRRCWETYQSNTDRRCDFCPLGQLKSGEKQSVEWEIYNEQTGRWFKNKSSIVRWADGRLVHLEQGTDITDIKKSIGVLREAAAATEKYTNLLHTSGEIAKALLSASPEDVDSIIIEQVETLGRAVGASRVSIWENFDKGTEKWHRQIYRWASDEKWYGWVYPINFEENYANLKGNAKLLFENRTINSPVRDLEAAEVEYFTRLGLKALVLIPITVNNGLWGFIAFDNCVNEKILPEIEVSVLRSTGVMIASAILRNRAKASLVSSERILKMDSELLFAVNHVASNLLAGDTSHFAEIMHGCLGIMGKSVDANRVSVWRNFQDEEGRLMSRRLSVWVEGQDQNSSNSEELTIDYQSFIPEWDKSATSRRDINRPLSEMSLPFRRLHKIKDSKAVILVRIEIGGDFWGFIAYIYSNEERLLEQAEADILRSGGTMIASAITQNDINQKLLVATDEALASVRAKNDFLARMSHEIRTPMNAIIGMTSIAAKSRDMEKIKESLDIVAAQSNQLLSHINDILDMSTIGIDSLDFARLPFNFKTMARDCIDSYKMQMEAKKQEFSFKISPNFSNAIVGDEKRVGQIISNLLSNAVKFTGEGGRISLSIDKIQKGPDTATVTIEVRDNGPGITKEFLPLIFDLFEQQDGGLNRSHGGIGLGLPITKNLVQLMGGTISVASTVAVGSAFTVTLPVTEGRPWDNAAQRGDSADVGADGGGLSSDTPFWQNKSVLLVEDIEINRLIAMELLADTGVAIDCAQNGSDALAMFLSSPGKYDLILMDMQMPVMDGLEATRRIRASNVPFAGSIPIYAMTANAYKEDAEACLNAGMNGHIPKPIDTTLLFKSMGEAFSD